MRYKGILFDLDGTLIDTSGPIMKSFEHAFDTVLGKKITRSEILNYWGIPLSDAMQDASTDKWEELLAVYRAHNLSVHDELVRPFPHVNDTLQQLHALGIKTAVVSSKISSLVKRGLKLYNMEEYFSDVIGAEHCEQHKPNPEPVLKGLEALGLSANECLMVGDTEFDILSARNAGVHSVAVSWSLIYPQPLLSRSQPTYVINAMPDLLKIIRK